MRTIRLGFLGMGVVGSGTLYALELQQEELEKRLGCKFELAKVAVLSIAEHKGHPLPLEVMTEDVWEVVRDPSIDIIIELMGGSNPAKDCILEALAGGKMVVSANKEVVAQHGDIIFEQVEKTGAGFFFEASVCGAIPIVRALKQSYAADRIIELVGIVNGTCNFILTEMDQQGQAFEVALDVARELGYAEADPTNDIEGYDAQRKLAILADLAFASRVKLSEVFVEGLKGIEPVDLAYAREFGYAIKLLAIAKAREEGIEARVHPALVNEEHPLASVRGVYNAVFVRSERIGEMMFYGPGAGSAPTGAIVAADIVEAAFNVVNGIKGATPCTCLYTKPVLPMSALNIPYYVRMLVEDRPGVLAQFAYCFGKHGVSLKAVIQKSASEEAAEIVWLTHPAPEGDVQASLAEMREMTSCLQIAAALRVYE